MLMEARGSGACYPTGRLEHDAISTFELEPVSSLQMVMSEGNWF